MTVQRSVFLAFLLISVIVAETVAGAPDQAELALYLRGDCENIELYIYREGREAAGKVNLSGDMTVLRSSPGTPHLLVQGCGSELMLKLTLVAGMRTVVILEHNDDGVQLVTEPRYVPISGEQSVVTADKIQALPFKRESTSPTSILPGVVGDDSLNIHGATQRANRYLVDGVDVTDPFSGTLELQLPFVALEQVSLKYDAPGAEGSTVSMTTKPLARLAGEFGHGGFSGKGSLFYETSDFPNEIEDLFYPRQREMNDAEVLFGWSSDASNKDKIGPGPPGLDAMRLIGAVRYQSDDFRSQLDRFKPIETRVPAAMLRFEKKFGLKWLLNANWYSSFTEKGNLFAPFTEKVDVRESDSDLVTADERHDVQLLNVSIDFRSLRTNANAWFSYYRGNLTREPSNGIRNTPTFYDSIAEPAILAGGSILDESRDDLRERLSFGATFERKINLFGSHRISANVSAEFSDIRIERAYNGGFSYAWSELLGRAFRRQFYEQDGRDSILDQRSIKRYRVELKDCWSEGPVSIDAGVTYDKTTGSNDVADVYDWSSVEPRFEARLDLLDNGEYLLHGGYHRSYFRLLGAQIPGNPYVLRTQFYGALSGSWESSSLNRSDQFGYYADRVDGDIDRPYADIVNLGADITLGERSNLSGSWTWRREQDLIEDIETNLWPNYTTEITSDELGRDFEYFIRNPGLDETLNPVYFLMNIEELEREYYGLDLSFTFEPDENTYIWAAYTWSRASGNIDNTLEESTGNSRVYNDPNERINADGFLSSDIRNILRLAFIWRAPLGVNVGSILRYDSGKPLNRLRLNPDVGRFEILADPRGSFYRADAATTIDLRLSKRFEFNDRIAGSVIIDLFNLTDDETPTAYYVDDEDFGFPIERREPRRWRLGLQFEF